MKAVVRSNSWELSIIFALAAALAMACAGGPKGAEKKPDAMSSASTVVEGSGSILAEIGSVQDQGALQGSLQGKTLVVYFTTGNASERVAVDLAALFSADTERLVERRVRKGGWGFMAAGADATFGIATPIDAPLHDPSAYDRVFVLTPVWSWHLAPPVRTWLRMYRGRLPEVAFGTISGDTEPDKIVASMAKEGGRKPFAYAGFSESDFKPENRGTYLEKLRRLAGLTPQTSP